jgi:hypothetical protein
MSKTITQEMLLDLPTPIQRYLVYTGVVGMPWIKNVRLKYTGKFRQAEDRPWMPMIAQESYTTDPASFSWDAKFKVAGIPILRVIDKYENGKGSMLGKLAGVKTIFNVKGDELDQGAMVRYLNEIMWFPTAFLSEKISWEELDDHSAQITFSDFGKSVSAQLFIDAVGQITNFTAQRYREIDGEFSLDSWSTPITGYREFNGLKLPLRGSALWHLPAGNLTYIELELKELEYDLAS